jgi:hypothetical protein
VAADVAGYSRLIGADEGGTLQALKAIRAELIDATIASYRFGAIRTTTIARLDKISLIIGNRPPLSPAKTPSPRQIPIDLNHQPGRPRVPSWGAFGRRPLERARIATNDPTLKPTKLDISETVRWLGYKPVYSLANLLSELAAFGDSGPPHITGNEGGACASRVTAP